MSVHRRLYRRLQTRRQPAPQDGLPAFERGASNRDVILDAAGTAPFSRIEHALAPRGRFVPVVGSLRDLVTSPWVNATNRRKIVSGVIRPQGKDLLLLQALASRGEYRAVIDRRYQLDQIVEAHRYVDTGRKRGSVIVSVGTASPAQAIH